RGHARSIDSESDGAEEARPGERSNASTGGHFRQGAGPGHRLRHQAAAKTFFAGQSGCFSHHVDGWSLYARLPHHGGDRKRIRAPDLGDDAGGHLPPDGPLSADWHRQTVRPLRAFPPSTRCTDGTCDAYVAPVWAATGSRSETLERGFG